MSVACCITACLCVAVCVHACSCLFVVACLFELLCCSVVIVCGVCCFVYRVYLLLLFVGVVLWLRLSCCFLVC